MSALTSQLIVSLIDRVTGPAKAVGKSVSALSGRLRAAADAQSAVAGRLQGQMFGAVAAGYSLQRALSAPISIASQFESALLDIGQKADLSDEAIKSLGERIRALAPQINQTSAEVAKGIDTLVGFGLAPREAETLMGPIGKAATAYKASIEDLSKAGYSALDNLKVKAEDFGQALDVMAQAGKEGAFELKDMAQYFPGLTASAQALGMTGVTAVGRLSAALEIARKGAADGSEAANNTANLMQKIISPETTKKFSKLGVDIRKELKKTQAAGGDVFEMIAAQTQKALKGDMSKLGDIFEDAQVQKFLRPLMQNLEEYRKIRDKALGAKSVVDGDFKRRMATTAAQIAAMKIRMSELATTIGDILRPALIDLLKSLNPMVERFRQFSEAHPAFVGGAMKIAAALVAARVAAIAARYAFSFLSAAFVGIAAPALAAVLAIGRLAKLAIVAGAIRPLIASLAALRAAMIGLAVVGTLGGLRMALAALAAGALALINPLRLLPALLGGAAIAMRGLGAAMLMIPGAAVLVAIGAAGTFIWNNWKGLGTFFTSFFAQLKSNLDSMDGGRFKVLSEAVESVSKVWSKWTGEISDKSWSDAGASAGDGVAKAIRSIADAIDAVLQKWESFKKAWNGVQDVLNFDVGKAAVDAVGGAANKLGIRSEGNPKLKAAREAIRRQNEEERRRLDVPVIGEIETGTMTQGSASTRPQFPGPAAAPDKPPEPDPQVWKIGAAPIENLDQSGPAGAAGLKTGAAYKDNFEAELKSVDAIIGAAMQRWSAMLGSFSASPTISPRINAPTGGAGGGQKGASLEGARMRQQSALADYGFGSVG